MIESSAGASSGASHASVIAIYGLAGVALIAAYVAPVPDLTPRQFKRFFVLSGLDVFIDQSLPALRAANPEVYADVVSQLNGGTVYFYAVAEHFMTQLLQILPNPPAVDFDQLRQLWIAQATHHVEI